MKKRLTTEDLQKINVELNKMVGELRRREPVTTKELMEALKIYGFPVNTVFISVLTEYGIFKKTKEGVYAMSAEPIHYMTYEKAYKKYREKQSAYRKNCPSANKGKVKAALVDMHSTNIEEAIQRAITLLKSQGDRFQITEKVVTVEYKEL